MIRILHLIAIAALVGTALHAYRVKYDTVFYGEQVAKLKNRIQREKDGIAMARADWQQANRMDRLQALADRHLDLQPITAQRFVKASDIPAAADRTDSIGRKLELLGLSEPTETPREPVRERPAAPGGAARPAGATTPR